MTADPIAKLLGTLIDGLTRERDLLLAGDYETVAEEAEPRAAVMEKLDALSRAALEPHAAQIDQLREAAQRNMRLLQAAIDGTAAGRQRLLDVLKAQTSLASYDASGAPVDRNGGRALGRKA
jgi:flagellar biosynthesis/type III secretory pathway chaperone